MTTENNNNNEQINKEGIDLLKQVFNEWIGQKDAEKQAEAEKIKFENDKKQIEAEQAKIAEMQKQAEENQKKIYEDVKAKAPAIDQMAKAFKHKSDLEDGIGFLTSINALIESEEYTADEIAKMVKNDFTEDDFAKFKASDDAAKITHKMHKICSKYKKTESSPTLPTPSNLKQEAEQPIRNNPAQYQNQMFTPTEHIKDFFERYKK